MQDDKKAKPEDKKEEKKEDKKEEKKDDKADPKKDDKPKDDKSDKGEKDSKDGDKDSKDGDKDDKNKTDKAAKPKVEEDLKLNPEQEKMVDEIQVNNHYYSTHFLCNPSILLLYFLTLNSK